MFDLRMKALRKLLVASGAILAIFVAFCAGSLWGTVRTTYDQNAVNLVWFIGIHDALEKGDTGLAKELCGTATAGHIEIIATAPYRRDTSGQLLAYALPFTRTNIRSHADGMLQATLQYSREHPSFLDEEQLSTLEDCCSSGSPR